MFYKILPIPFAQSLFGTSCDKTYKRILNVNGANDNSNNYFPSELISDNCTILDPVQFTLYPDDQSDKASFLKSNLSMATNSKIRIEKDFDIIADQICVIGGDHSIAIGTGAGLSTKVDMSKVGLIWVDAHGDFNTSESSKSKSVTGYPCAINSGIGLKEFTELYNGNFIHKIVQIGIRDVEQSEQINLQKQNVKSYSTLEVEKLGIKTVIQETLLYLESCDYIWLSIDFDSLDAVYFQESETDEPVFGGLTPRELLLITSQVQESSKLKIFELVQLNDVGKQTSLVVLASRLIELSFGLGKFRYNK
jgi:arginase